MRRLLISVGCTAALIAPFLPVQHAAAKAGKCVSDPRGDTHKAPKPKADYDFTAACAHKASQHRIIATAKIVGTVQVPSDPQGRVPSLLIDVPGQKFDNPTCDYFVQGTPPGAPGNKTDHTKYFVNTCQNTASKQVGPAAVTRPSTHVLKVVIHRHEIGNPAKFGFAFYMPSDGDQTPFDRVADKGYEHIRLR